MSKDIFVDELSTYALETLATHYGQQRGLEGEHSDPIYATSSFVFASAAHAAARFAGKEPGNIYSRFTNPTVRTFEQRLAVLEQAKWCVATASGMSAILTCCLAILKQGDHIVSSSSLFGSTLLLFKNILSRFGIETTFVAPTDYRAWEQAIGDSTKLLFLETPSNPLTEIADISKLAELAHDHQCLLAVDNCFCTPVLQKPLALGADLVLQSATKYIDGQGRSLGGAVLGNDDAIGESVYGFLRTAGPSLSAFNAWVLLKGLETLSLRMQAHCANALKIAEWLSAQQGVKKVYYPGLDSHPQHDLASQQMTAFGGIVAFELDGGKQAAWHLIDSTKLISITANLGDTKTTITHPATTTHGRLSDQERQLAGIDDGLVRLSVGIEAVEDLIKDLSRGM